MALPTDVPPQLPHLEEIVTSILGVVARLIGIVAFIFLIIGGYQLLTASGDPKKAETAQKTLTGAVVGIVIVIGGWFFLKLLEEITGATLTTFKVCIVPPCN